MARVPAVARGSRALLCFRSGQLPKLWSPLQYGTPAWLDQHDALQQLNLQAHLNAQAHSDEFVKEALVSHDRVTLLVRELLAAEAGGAAI